LTEVAHLVPTFAESLRAALAELPATGRHTGNGGGSGSGSGSGEQESQTSRLLWQALGRHGVLSQLFEAGQRAPRADRLAELLTALDARFELGVVLSVCVQVATALPILREHAGQESLAGVYDLVAGGQSQLALAATDLHGAGSDLMSLATTATLHEDHLVLDGGKQWITNACTAGYALVLARHRPQRHFTSFLWVLVPLDAPGVRVEPAPTALFAGAGVGTLGFEGVVLERGQIVGSPGRGLATFVRHVATERLAGGVWASALCRRVLADTRDQLLARQLDQAGLWENPAIQQRYARCLLRLWQIDAACASQRTAPAEEAMVSSMLLKTTVGEAVDEILGECVRLLGARAFDVGGVAQLRTEAAMFGIAGGAAGAMLAGICDHAEVLLAGGHR
jgi:acyl-CoA dehydrogenase